MHGNIPHALADVSHLNEEICHIVSAGGDYRMTSNYMSKLVISATKFR